MSITVDTNVYVAALNFGSRAARLLGMAEAGLLQIDISDHIELELVRVLREDFGWEGYRIRSWWSGFGESPIASRLPHTVRVVDDPDDNKIVECAAAASSDYIVTNDNALLRIGEYAGIRIVRVSEFLERGR